MIPRGVLEPPIGFTLVGQMGAVFDHQRVEVAIGKGEFDFRIAVEGKVDFLAYCRECLDWEQVGQPLYCAAEVA